MTPQPTYRPPQRADWPPAQTQVTRLDPDQLPDREPVTNYLERRRNTFVPAAPSRVEMPRVELARPDLAVTLDYVPTSTTHVQVTGDHVNRSQAWLRYSLPLCLAFAFVVLVLAWLFSPLLDTSMGWAFLRAMAVYFGTFVVSYAGLFFFYIDRSPEGQAYRNSRDMWRFLRDEQSHRHTIEREAWTIQRDRLTGGRQ